MRKFLIVLSFFIFGINVYNAECSYKDLRELNTFAAYVESSYKYNEETGLFDLTITNLGNKAYITGENTIGDFYYPVNGQVSITNLELGTTYRYTVGASANTNCVGEILRTLTVRIPYKNNYYGSEACVGHEDLNVCNSRFLDYELSLNTFMGLLNKKTDSNKKEEENKQEEEKTLIDRVIDVVSSIYIKVIIVVVTSIILISIYEVIIRKIKHGF